MITVQNPAGRLVVITSVAPINMADVAGLKTGLGAVFAKLPGQRVVACVDMLRSGVVAQDISDVFKQMLQTDNPLMERSGWLLQVEKAALALQVERLIREANNPNRRSFTDANEMVRWLSTGLAPDEQRALKDHVARL